MINALKKSNIFEKDWSSDQASLVNNENYWELLGGIREWEKKICSGFLSFSWIIGIIIIELIFRWKFTGFVGGTLFRNQNIEVKIENEYLKQSKGK